MSKRKLSTTDQKLVLQSIRKRLNQLNDFLRSGDCPLCMEYYPKCAVCPVEDGKPQIVYSCQQYLEDINAMVFKFRKQMKQFLPDVEE